MKQIPLEIAPQSSPSFAHYLVGANQLAVLQLQSLRPGESGQPPVYVWGLPGTGKTHLLGATMGAWRAAGHRVACLDASIANFDRTEDSAELIAFDDCERFNAEQQQAAFSMFVDAVARGAAVVAAGLLPPVDLPLRDDLRTRLGWGHVIALQPLSEPQTRAAVVSEAQRRGIVLTEEVLNHLLTRFARDLKHLMRLLDRLDVFALTHKRAVTVPLLKQMLAEEGPLE